ncbi:MAG: ribose-phosphate diphosphokinase [Holosporales bacterium]|jgi:ribose-phosphate pyrophosphokinase|nr:ribose-phosphate diphosphokinase [Holosporales bacterium]
MRLLCDTLAIPLGERVASLLRLSLVRCTIRSFPDGEADVALQESVEDESVFILSSAVASSWVPLLLLLDAVVHARPRRIYLCFAYFGYGRQDRRTTNGGAYAIQRLAKLLGTFPLERVYIIDLHNPSSLVLFPMPCACLSPSKIFYSYLIDTGTIPDVLVAPDLGAIHRAQQLSALCALPWYFLDKKVARREGRQRFQGKKCVLVDDLVDSGHTLCHAADVLRREGAQSVMAFATHGLFANTARQEEVGRFMEKLIVTDTLPFSPHASSIVQQITVAPLVVELYKSLCDYV